jgi:ABC-type multidrug transport system ATPase subunit
VVSQQRVHDCTPAIDVRALSKLHGAKAALLDLTFSVKAGALAAIVGGPGSGKSTLLKLLAGHMIPTGGRIRICGKDVRTERLHVMSRIGYVPQAKARFGEMRACDLLQFSGRARGLTPLLLEQRQRDVAGFCTIDELMQVPFARLGAADRARVTLAQALLHDPQVLLLDDVVEPLSPAESCGLAEILQRLRGRLTVLVSGAPSLPGLIATDHVLQLNDGRLVFDGQPEPVHSSV